MVVGGPACSGRQVYHLPVSLYNPRKRPFHSLPCVLPPIKKEDEEKIVISTMEEVVEQYGLKLNTSPSFEHGVETLADPISRDLIFIFGPHT
jgi:hypothetical protein